MKKLIEITAVFFIFASVFFASCEKQELQTDGITFVKNNSTLVKNNFETESGLIGDLYSYEGQDIILLNDVQPKAQHDDIEPTGTFNIEYKQTNDGPTNVKIRCEGEPFNCTETSDFIIIWNR